MKRMLLVMLVVCLMLVGLAPVLAETQTAVNWGDEYVTGSLERLGLNGAFWTLNCYPVRVWVPEDMHYVEPAEDELAQGVKVKFTNEDESFGLVVVYYASSSYTGAEDLAESQRAKSNLENVTELSINGLPCVSYRNNETGYIHGVFYLADTQLLVFTFYGAQTENQQLEASLIACSVQNTESAEAAAAQTEPETVNWADTAGIREQLGLKCGFMQLNAAPYMFAVPEGMRYETPSTE